MNALSIKPPAFTDFNVQFNESPVDQLFKKYDEIGFIYPAKKAMLQPFFDKVSNNWKKLKTSKKDLLWILTNKPEEKNFASISVWKQSNYGLMAQHLVSDGNPFLSLKVMLAAQFKAEHHYGDQQVRSSQNWFRPDNRYAYRIFASMFEKLGNDKASLIKFQYLHLGMNDIEEKASPRFQAKTVQGIDQDLIEFVTKQHGPVFVKAEELDQEDILLAKISKDFKKIGLDRSRKVLKIIDQQTLKTVACIVANRAPIGLNFSLLENRAYYIIDADIEESQRLELLKTMNASIKSYYQDFELGAVPIVTDEASSKQLQLQKAVFFRNYIQSIWMREGFAMWYDHISSFLKKIETRLLAKKAA